MQTEPLARLFNYTVVDAAGAPIGSVGGVWVDEATNQLEFIGMRAELPDHTFVIPSTRAEIGEGTVRVPYPREQITGAPQCGPRGELTAQEEERIYSHFGIERSTEVSPTGLPGEAGQAAAPRSRRIAEAARNDVPNPTPIRPAATEDQSQPAATGDVARPADAGPAPASAPPTPEAGMRVQTDGGSGAANAPIIYEPTMAEPPMIGLVLLVGVPLVIGVVVLIMSLVKGSRTGERTPTEATASARRAARARGRRT